MKMTHIFTGVRIDTHYSVNDRHDSSALTLPPLVFSLRDLLKSNKVNVLSTQLAPPRRITTDSETLQINIILFPLKISGTSGHKSDPNDLFFSKKKQQYQMRVNQKLNEFLVVDDQALSLNIMFNGDKASYLYPENAEIDALYLYLQLHPSYQIEIQGHVCCYNEYKLSKKRAKTVYNDLMDKGISKERMSYEGYGNTRPLVRERDEFSRQKNRRVDILILKE